MSLAGKAAGAALLLIILLSIFSPFVSSFDPNGVNLEAVKKPPSYGHIFGTDSVGRDIFARVLAGGRVSLGISVSAAVVSMCIGLLMGLVSGFAGGKVDLALNSFMDLILSFPSLLLAVGISMMFPPGVHTVTIAISAVGWVSFARLVRGQTLVLKEAAFMDAARAVGCGRSRMLFVHLLPQCVPLVLVLAGVKMSGYILTESALSFLGIGIQPPDAAWGAMVSSGRSYLHSAPWMALAPGFMIALTSVCFNILGDELKKLFDLRES